MYYIVRGGFFCQVLFSKKSEYVKYSFISEVYKYKDPVWIPAGDGDAGAGPGCRAGSRGTPKVHVKKV
jgi:hypothetical protein